VYIDDGTAGDSGELNIEVDGHDYVEQDNIADGAHGSVDGSVVDAVSVDTGDGGHLVYSDEDHDGTADLVTEYDEQGDPTRHAHYDTDTGRWIDGSADAGSITVDTAAGDLNIGPATVDTDHDGTPDTAVVHDENGDTVLYTDRHGTGRADIATELTPDGQVIIADHTGDHEWTRTRHGSIGDDGHYTGDGAAAAPFTPPVGADAIPEDAPATDAVVDAVDAAADEHWTGGDSGWAGAFSAAGSARGVVRIDATTGQWISQN
jgi:hypothetical protein